MRLKYHCRIRVYELEVLEVDNVGQFINPPVPVHMKIANLQL